MFKTLFKASLLSFVGLTCLADFAYAATLRMTQEFEKEVITVGDIFNDAGKYQDRVITQAPAPGKKITFDVRTLAKIARLYKVDWQPTTRYDKVTLQRASLIIDTDYIVDTLRAELAQNSKAVYAGADRFTVKLDNKATSWHLPTDVDATIAVKSLTLNPITKRFSATLVSPAEGAPKVQRTVTGKVISMIEIPVLADTMRPGDIIAANDIDWIDIAYDKKASRLVRDEKELIGKTPRRSLIAGQAIRTHDLEEPTVISRNSTVMIRAETGALTITAKGRALDDAAKGETVRVMNLQSKKTIEGIATGYGEVTVGTVIASSGY